MKKIVIGSDKSGFTLKEAVKAHLAEAGYEGMPAAVFGCVLSHTMI